VVSTQVNAMIEESGLGPFESEDLVTFLTMLESLVDESAPAPAPTAALAAMLAGGATGVGASVVALAARRHQNALAAAVLAVTGIVATGVAAAANDLPPTAQRIVAEFSDRFLPFDFPQPEDRAGNLAGDADDGGGPTVGADDGEADAGVQDDGAGHQPWARGSSDRDGFGDESGDATPDSDTRDDGSGTQVIATDGDDHESDDDGPREQQDINDADGDDSDDSSSGETDDQAEDATTGDGDGTVDTSGESDGGDSEQDDDTRDSAEAIDD